MNDLSMGEVYETKTNYKKYIQDLRDQYPFDPLSVLITESFANSMDAGATQIDIYVDEESYKIKDNGKGMTKYEFIEYHNIASLTKEKGKGGIGFAGIGAKTYLDLANHIYTETKSKSFYGASKWRFDGEVPRWEVVYPKGLIKETGTFIEVKLNTNDVGKITEEFVKKTLQEHYNAVLLGLYKVKEVRVNGKLAKPWKPEQIEEHSEFKFKISGHEVNGFFIKASDEIPEEFQGVSIVVYGKTVNRNEWFRQFTLYNEKIMGMMIADYLISIVNTSKTQFIKTSSLWRKFYLEASLRFSQWLDNIGAKFNPPKISSDTDIMVRRLEKSINEVLNTPELSDLANTLFQNKLERTTVIKSVDGQLAGVEVEGSQKVSGTLGNSTTGSKVNTIGPDEGKGVIENESGNVKVERVRRRMKTGIKIGFFENPEDLNEGWIDPASQTITINTGHPAYKIACGLSIDGKMYHVWIYHILRTAIKTLLKEAEKSTDVENKLLLRWYEQTIGDEIKRQIGKLFPIGL